MNTTTRTTRPIVPARSGRPGRWGTIALWTVQALLAASFASAAVQKLAGTPYMVSMFAEIGAGQWLRYAIGVMELAGAVGLLVPRLSGLAALGLAALMVGASITNVLIHYNLWVPLLYLLLAAVTARGRWPRTRQLFTLPARKGTRP